MRIHLLGLVHTETTKQYEWCAYSGKCRKLATMLTSAGIDVVLYAGEENEANCAEHVPLVTRAEQAEWFGHYDWSRDVFNDFDAHHPWWQTFNQRAAKEIRKRSAPGDILGLTMGTSQQQCASLTADLGMLPVEVGVGYSGVFAPYRVYESWAWRNYLAAKEPTDDVRFYDDVIPNFFEVDDFPEGKGDGGYLLYVGRLIQRKGPHVAAQAAARLGMKLLVAGQGVEHTEPGKITCLDGTVLEGDVEYVGVVGPKERAELMGGATALFCPTLYLEPFGGVSVEAQMCGTPAIVTANGGLIENVIDGQTGFACRTLAEFTAAAEKAPNLNRTTIREHAIATWSTDVLRWRYVDYFNRLQTLFGNGWYS